MLQFTLTQRNTAFLERVKNVRISPNLEYILEQDQLPDHQPEHSASNHTAAYSPKP